ncbi:MAG TPA: DNA polymerase III subunit beta [Limnochordia bacterium]|nr:DNA polymerase III subunit beta [Limnochordia bacterium]
MRFTCAQTDFMRGVATVERAVSSKDQMPALSGILLVAQDQRIRLVATDLELALECTFTAEIDEPGAAVIDGRMLSQMVRRSPGEQISISPAGGEDERRLKLRSGSAQFIVHTLAAEEFPALPTVAEADWITLGSDRLATLFRRTVFAAADDDGRPFLSGVCIELDGHELRCVATDSYQLTIDKEPLPAEHKAMRTILPRRSVQELVRSFGGVQGEVRFCVAQNQAVFESASIKLISRLIEGEFPNYAQVFPNERPTVAELDRAALLSALERSVLITQRGTPWVLLDAQAEGRLAISAREAEIGEAYEELEITLTGEPNKNAYNARYLIDALRALDGERVLLEIRPGGKQGSVRLVGDEAFTYIIMPTVIHQ